MLSISTLTLLALLAMSFALIVAVPALYAYSDDSGHSNRLNLIRNGA
ncbi:photosystem II reaction center protein PsbZ [Synechococcus sp. Tobar12-5m-g]|nr:photosystem II reaction center protein PsbZ [Synechococcus sp. Tobar12-5m-g]MCP9874024.1 photosystem II reaction center protein PsbZ [Synechococcus sp. Cruz CV-v-12]